MLSSNKYVYSLYSELYKRCYLCSLSVVVEDVAWLSDGTLMSVKDSQLSDKTMLFIVVYYDILSHSSPHTQGPPTLKIFNIKKISTKAFLSYSHLHKFRF